MPAFRLTPCRPTLIAFAGLCAAATFGPLNADPVTLTILHNNDGESSLLADGEKGSVANFTTLVRNQRSAASVAGHYVVTLSSGDNTLPGTTFSASQAAGVSYDALALNAIGYDALAIGNHEFDSGPQAFASIVEQVDAPFVSANLNYNAVPSLQALADAMEIQDSVLVSKTVDGTTRQYGIVGATTTNLRGISSPGLVDVETDLISIINQQAASLKAQGAEKVILISHLQDVETDIDLVANLSGVDVVIAGGGDELLANPDAVLLPGDSAVGPYPVTNTELNGTGTVLLNADGQAVPVITTAGNYNYLGRLDLTYDDVTGEILSLNGNPIPNLGSALTPDPEVQAQVVDPVTAFVADLDQQVIGRNDITLLGDGDRDFLRAREVALGNLFADAYLHAVSQLEDSGALESNFGLTLDDPLIALQNAGGIRATVEPGDFTVLDSFNVAPFTNFVGIVEDVDPQTLKQLLEAAVSRTTLSAQGEPVQGDDGGTGRFAQIGGFSIVYDINAQPFEQPTAEGEPVDLDADGNFNESPGIRIVSIQLDDGTYIVKDGQILADAPDVDIATIDFLFNGGDQYDFGDATFTSLGITYQSAVEQYLRFLTDELDGAAFTDLPAYALLGEGRITLGTQNPDLRPDGTVIPSPVALPAGLLGLALLAGRRRRSR